MFCGPLEQAAYPDNYFDVVRASATLEHITHPYASIRESLRVLRKGGLFLFSVPSIESLVIRILSKRYRYLCEGHLYYFSRASITHLLQRAGFKKYRAIAEGFDIFPFLEDFKGRVPESTAKTTLKESNYVAQTKQRWYYRPVKTAYRSFLSTLKLTGTGEYWYVCAWKE